MPLLLVVGTINKYPPPGPDWRVVHVDKSERGIWDPDLGRNVQIDVVADMRQLPVLAGSVDRLQSWHTLEHVNQRGGRDAIQEFARVLTPGGILDIRVPDMGYIQRVADVESVLNLIYGDQSVMPDAELNVHRWGYTKFSLVALLDHFGFTVIERPEPEYPDEIHFIARKACN